MRCELRIAFALVLLGLATPARAFDTASQFFVPMGVTHTATLGASAEGIYFTGAPRWSGLDCSSCHTGGPQKVTLRIAADDPTLFTTGYIAEHTYELEVAIGDETEGRMYSTPTCTEVPGQGDTYAYVQCNNNNFSLEVDSDGAALAGPNVFCAAPPVGGVCPTPNDNGDEVVVAPTSDAVFANDAHSMSMPYERLHNDDTSWHLWWTAPPAGIGPVTVYVAAVDGNGGAGTVADDQDPYGDDTVHAVVAIREAGTNISLDAHAGCSFAPHPDAAGCIFSAIFVLLALSRRRRHG